MTYIFAPVIQNDRLPGEPVALLSSSGGKNVPGCGGAVQFFGLRECFINFTRLIRI